MNLILIKTGVNMFAVIRNGVTVGTIQREKSTGNTCGMQPASTAAKASSNRNARQPNGLRGRRADG